ncbi:MAG: hypothetical protein QXI09_01605 [Candidatus Aenigmatarchaeota archaeon]
MKFITAYTITCRNSSKEHKHYVCFSLFFNKREKSYVIYFENVLNNEIKEEKKIAIFFSEKLARKFLNTLLKSVNNNLERFKI